MAAVCALALFTTRTVSLFLSRRNAMRTEWKRGKSDEIMSHGSTSRGVILALFMAAMRHSPAAPVLFFGLLDVIYNTPKAFCFTTEQVSSLWQSILVWWPGHGRFLPIDAGSIWLVFNHTNILCHLGIIARATGKVIAQAIASAIYACCECNHSQIALESMWLPIQIYCINLTGQKAMGTEYKVLCTISHAVTCLQDVSAFCT